MLNKSHNDKKIQWRIEGPFDSTYSLALLNRELARALAGLGVEVALHSTEGAGDFSPSLTFLEKNGDLKEMNERINAMTPQLANVTSRNLYPPRVADMCSPINLLHSYAWEESSFPMEWVRNFNENLSGMTCLSEHVLKVMQDNGVSVPMAVSGCGVDHWERIIASADYSIDCYGAREFRFLHVSSCFPRKGPEALLDAYGLAFSFDDNVSLIIKTFPNPHNRIHELLDKCRVENSKYPHVIIIEEDLSDQDLKALYKKCQILVAPSCAEGFGLPLAEAMLTGLPVIVTAWSGQMDFCNSDNSWLVDFKFEQADTHFNLLPSAWAAIDNQALADAMLLAHHAPEEQRRAMAESGRALLLENFTWENVAIRLINFYKKNNSSKARSVPLVGWISTWNVKCGIATYSDHLLSGLPLTPVLLAAKGTSLLNSDDENCIRCWTVGDDDDLEELAAAIDARDLNNLIIQFNFGFFHHESLARFISLQKSSGRTVIIDLHATIDPPQTPNKHMADYISALELCDRILVHSIADMNRMKVFGLVEKLVLFPHGILDVDEPQPLPEYSIPTIATYGFCLPHKGLPEVLEAVALLRDQGKIVNLKMVNAEYPIDFSHDLACSLQNNIAILKLEEQATLTSSFLPDSESLRLLQTADLIIFAYHPTSESASGAVRYGLACGRPTLVTDLPIFDELGESVWRVASHEPHVLADKIWKILGDIRSDSQSAQQRSQIAKNWRSQHKYSSLSYRLNGLIESLNYN